MLKKTALITGASVGIGKAIATELAQAGYQLVLLARREQKLQELQSQFGSDNVHIIGCDINNHAELDKKISELPEQFSNIDVLVNNAGLALGMQTADKTDWQDWQTMIETNCLSLAYLTRQILPQMVKNDSGYIINIGSIAGNYAYKGGNVYGATKAFVDQFSINLRADLVGTKIRVCNVQPGMLGDTEFSLVRFHGDKNAADAVYQDYEPLTPEDIGRTVAWIVEQPERVNINRIEVMPTCQAPAGLVLSKAD